MPTADAGGPGIAIPSQYLVSCPATSVFTYDTPTYVPASPTLDEEILAKAIAESFYGWRVAGGDDLYFGTPMYPFDAHDDTVIFTYNASQASVRAVNVARNHYCEQTLLHASASNCTREILEHYAHPFIEGDGKVVYMKRPIYADGTLGEVCLQGADDPLSSCSSGLCSG